MWERETIKNKTKQRMTLQFSSQATGHMVLPFKHQVWGKKQEEKDQELCLGFKMPVQHPSGTVIHVSQKIIAIGSEWRDKDLKIPVAVYNR